MAAKNSSTFTVTTPTDREILITRDFDAPRRLVFEAWTSPEHLPHWLLGPEGWSMPVCEADLRPGGLQRWVWRHANGNEMEIRSVLQEIVPPERIISIESWGGNWPDTRNTVLFTEHNGITTVTLTILYPTKEARDAALESGMKHGIAISYDRLDNHLAAIVASH